MRALHTQNKGVKDQVWKMLVETVPALSVNTEIQEKKIDLIMLLICTAHIRAQRLHSPSHCIYALTVC